MSRGIPREEYPDHASADLALGADEKLAVLRPLRRREEIANNEGGKRLGSLELLPSPTAAPMTTTNYRKRTTGRKIRSPFSALQNKGQTRRRPSARSKDLRRDGLSVAAIAKYSQ